MELVLHIGAHFTEDERLARCLLRNQGDFAQRAIAVPGPGRYRSLLRDTLNAMAKAPAADGARDVLLDAILDDAPANRVILSDPNFQRTAGTAFQGGVLYPAGPVRMQRLAQLFAGDTLKIFIALRNPATLMPVLWEKAADKDPQAFWGGREPQDVRWSETIGLIRDSVPDAELTVWCSEDSPLIWAEIIRALAGLEPGEKIVGGFDLLGSIMSAEGMKRFRAYLKQYPVMTDLQKRKVIAAFLDKFAIPDQIEEELDMPGWTDDLVEELSEIYDADMQAITQIPGVRVLSP